MSFSDPNALIVNIIKPGYILSGHCPENITGTHVSAYCCKSLGESLIHTKIKAVECYAKTAMKMHGNPRSQIHKKHILVDLNRINACAKSPLRTILYQFTGDVPLCSSIASRTPSEPGDLNPINKFSFANMHLKMLSAKYWLFCFGLYVLTLYVLNFSEGT